MPPGANARALANAALVDGDDEDRSWEEVEDMEVLAKCRRFGAFWRWLGELMVVNAIALDVWIG